MTRFFQNKAGAKYANLSYDDFSHFGAPTHYDTRTREQLFEELIKHDKVIIDELIGFKQARKQNIELLSAIKMAKEKKPSMYIALWSNYFYGSSLLDIFTFMRFMPFIDLLIFEMYYSYSSKFMMFFLYKLQYLILKLFGNEKKTIFGIGLNDVYFWDLPAIFKAKKEKGDFWSICPWSNTPDILNKQLSYISKNCPNMPGVGFFTIASAEVVERADIISKYYFPD